RVRDFNPASGKCGGLMIVLDGTRQRFVGFDEADPFHFAHRPQEAPIVHIEGPLAVRVYGEPPALVAGPENELKVAVGTPGVGKGSFCALHCRTLLDGNAVPFADIEFPAREAGDAPRRERVPVADGSRDSFLGPVQVPEGAGNGLAKVTVSCPG